MSDVFRIKRGDLLPTIAGNLEKESDGSPIDLSQASSMRFLMRPTGAASPCVATTATILSGTAGLVEYAWQDNDTATAGAYQGEFEFYLGGKRQTVPNRGYIPIVIEYSIG
jgi:hypothetical protein